MNILYSLIKEFLELLLRNFRKLFVTNRNIIVVKSLKKDGLYIVPNYLSKNKCKQLRDKIDEFISNNKTNVWQDAQGADSRIYFINELNEEFQEIYEKNYFKSVLKEYCGITQPEGFLLAGKINSVEGNIGSGGGWHRDSPVSHQLKAIIYLSDVDTENGPFQYIKGSCSKKDVITSYFKKIFKPGQYRFSDTEIDNYISETGNVVTDIVAEQGTLIFADTKGLHRGKPIEVGERYVLFCYYWNKKIPGHFEGLKQKKK